jgi:hypothetical protein
VLLLSFISEMFMFLLVSMNASHFLDEKKVTKERSRKE